MSSMLKKMFQDAADKKARKRAASLGAKALYAGGYEGKNFKAAMDILDEGGDVNYVDPSGTYEWDSNLAFFAIFRGADGVFNEFLKRNLDVNLTNTLQTPLLCYAIKKGEMEIALKLIDSGANLNVTNASYETPLMLATKQGKRNVIKAIQDKLAATAAAPNDNEKRSSTFMTIEVVRRK